jgi:16S rRNA (cytosine1402-N4)-methyltransferase
MIIHQPVLLKESIEALNLKKGDTVVDATLGGGGHSLEILKKILPAGKLIAIDLDPEAIEKFHKILKDSRIKLKAENLKVVHVNFAELGEVLFSLKISEASAILADFGISSDQLKDSDRGFSFQKDAPLDMRMNRTSGATAADVVNYLSEKDLERILRDYGDERYARRIAQSIAKQRKIKPIQKTLELASVIEKAIPYSYKHQKISFATRTFQALRIEVNKELENIKKFLPQAIDLLRKKGRLAAITFHSGEDRIVKNIFRENARGCICPPEFPVCRCGQKPKIKIITRKPIAPSEEEIRDNPRSRSAKLRVVEKL